MREYCPSSEHQREIVETQRNQQRLSAYHRRLKQQHYSPDSQYTWAAQKKTTAKFIRRTFFLNKLKCALIPYCIFGSLPSPKVCLSLRAKGTGIYESLTPDDARLLAAQLKIAANEAESLKPRHTHTNNPSIH